MGNRTITTALLAATLALAAAACGDVDNQGVAEPVPPTSVSDGLPLYDAGNSDIVGSMLVEGFIVAQGDNVRLASVLAESFPPQAAGVVMTVIGLDLNSVDGLTRSGGVSWTDHQVQLRGTVDGDVLTVSAAPIDGGEAGSEIPMLTLEDDRATLSVEVGDVVTLELEGNPTTGFTWEIASIDEAVLVAAGDPLYRSDSDLAGSAGVFTFRFQAVGEGETQVEIMYHRPWEDTEPLQTYGFTAIVG